MYTAEMPDSEVSANPILSATGKRWEVKPQPSEEELADLRTIKGLNETVAKLLAQREILSEEMLKTHFNPDLGNLHDPMLMLGMDAAVARIAKAIANGERIQIYGDYDVDGTTAIALTYKYLSLHHSQIEFYTPDRYKEGYGISTLGIDTAEAHGVSLIISLDCGIKSTDKVLYAKAKGIDFVICDHHLPGPEIPDAIAVLDPKQPGCPYPYKELSGCGVGFKLLHALSIALGWDVQPLFNLLDLVAVSIASDIVPVTGENRILMHHGLAQINTQASAGLQALMDVAGFKPQPEGGGYKLQVENLVFGLGPRINAAGRIGHGSGAVNLLISNSVEEAMAYAGKVDDQNLERKELDKSITQEALDMIQTSDLLVNAYSTVLFQPHWHKGVIGIVASRCIEKYHRPTVILTESDGKITGSARSVFGFDLYQAIDACSGHLVQFGGHYFAAGLTLLPEQLPYFQEAFEAQVQSKMTKADLQPRLVADIEIPLSAIQSSLYKQMQRMGPFGPHNMNPLFVTCSVADTGQSRFLAGKNGGPGHIKFSLKSLHQQPNQPIEAEGIGFGLGSYWDIVASGKPFDIAYHIEENEFRGQKRIQLQVKDIRPSPDAE